MRWRLLPAAAVLACPLVLAAVMPAGASGERPPECKTVPVAGLTVKVTFCGTGSGGESPLRHSVSSLYVEKEHGHWFFFWPGSWQS